MMSNLFSTFDPSTGITSMNWMAMMLTMTTPTKFWNTSSKLSLTKQKIMKSMHWEIKMITKTNKTSILMLTMFMIILTNNMYGMIPYIFTPTAQMSYSMPMALSMWMSMMIFGWTKNTNKMLSHLVPIGTPNLLMPFMVMIETTSNIIRPMSLALRLSANMIAGHLLMALLGNSASVSTSLTMLWMFMMIMTFEMCVSMIQSYVFTMLSSLYSSEI